mmetsp:Transcript_10921/g.22823  ORF Transcript_10921/g.22823 Transcript_10921/m.22823 type:complete len:309 (-) Transcript_10921:2639-3565(-)
MFQFPSPAAPASSSSSSSTATSTGGALPFSFPMPSSNTPSSAANVDHSATSNKKQSLRSGGFSFQSTASSSADAGGGGGALHSFGRSLPPRAAAGFGNVGGTGVLTGSSGSRTFDADPFEGRGGVGGGRGVRQQQQQQQQRQEERDGRHEIAISRALAVHPSSESKNNDNRRYGRNNDLAVEHSCFSFDGRSFHSYLYDAASDRHVIVSEFAPFGNPNGDRGGDLSNEDEEGAGSSSIKITTDLSSSSNTIGKALDIDPVLELLCVDHSSNNGGIGSGGARRRRQWKERLRTYKGGEDFKETLPCMCL